MPSSKKKKIATPKTDVAATPAAPPELTHVVRHRHLSKRPLPSDPREAGYFEMIGGRCVGYPSGRWVAVDAVTAERLARHPVSDDRDRAFGKKGFEPAFDVLTRDEFKAFRTRLASEEAMRATRAREALEQLSEVMDLNIAYGAPEDHTPKAARTVAPIEFSTTPRVQSPDEKTYEALAASNAKLDVLISRELGPAE